MTATDPAPEPEPIASDEIQWGHRLDPAYPTWNDFDADDRAEVARCPLAGQCPHPRIAGYPAVHVYRRVIATTWQEGQP